MRLPVYRRLNTVPSMRAGGYRQSGRSALPRSGFFRRRLPFLRSLVEASRFRGSAVGFPQKNAGGWQEKPRRIDLHSGTLMI